MPSLFLNKVAGLNAATLLKERLWHKCFPVIYVKFLRTPFYNTPLGDCLSGLHSLLFTRRERQKREEAFEE